MARVRRRRASTMPTSPAPPTAPQSTVETRTIYFNNRDDLAYIEALADTVPLLTDRTAPGCITKDWRAIVKGLIARIRELED